MLTPISWRFSTQAVAIVLLASVNLTAAAATATNGPSAPLAPSVPAVVKQFLQQINQGLGSRESIQINTPLTGLENCASPVAFLPGPHSPSVGQITLGIRCGGQSNDTHYLQIDVHVFGPYVVASQDIPPGTVITADDLAVDQGDITNKLDRLPGDEQKIIGEQSRRRIQKSSTITNDMLEAPDVIHRGDPVTVEVAGPGFSVTTQGSALDNAAAGQAVRVRTSNGTVVTGQPDGPGTVLLQN